MKEKELIWELKMNTAPRRIRTLKRKGLSCNYNNLKCLTVPIYTHRDREPRGASNWKNSCCNGEADKDGQRPGRRDWSQRAWSGGGQAEQSHIVPVVQDLLRRAHLPVVLHTEPLG